MGDSDGCMDGMETTEMCPRWMNVAVYCSIRKEDHLGQIVFKAT